MSKENRSKESKGDRPLGLSDISSAEDVLAAVPLPPDLWHSRFVVGILLKVFMAGIGFLVTGGLMNVTLGNHFATLVSLPGVLAVVSFGWAMFVMFFVGVKVYTSPMPTRASAVGICKCDGLHAPSVFSSAYGEGWREKLKDVEKWHESFTAWGIYDEDLWKRDDVRNHLGKAFSMHDPALGHALTEQQRLKEKRSER